MRRGIQAWGGHAWTFRVTGADDSLYVLVTCELTGTLFHSAVTINCAEGHAAPPSSSSLNIRWDSEAGDSSGAWGRVLPHPRC